MPHQMTLNPLILLKFVLWIVIIIVATILLRRRAVTSKLRFAFLAGGVLILGIVFGLLISDGMNPNPVTLLRTLLAAALLKRQLMLPIAAMLIILLLTVLISNKSICGWGCQLGLVQDLLYRIRLPKWKPPFWLANTVRILAFVTLITGLILGGLDWIGFIDPFQLFAFKFTLWIGLFSISMLAASLFVYRPWCQFLCPFGLIGWLVEQTSLLRPRINRTACKECELCVKACPSQAMADFYSGKKIHADCFACGACIEACPQKDALGWWTSSQARKRLAPEQVSGA